jgi:hypothetical protein
MKKKQQRVKVEHQLLNNYLQEKQLILLQNHQHRNEHLHQQKTGTSRNIFVFFYFRLNFSVSKSLVRRIKNLLEYQLKNHQIQILLSLQFDRNR